MADVTAFAKAAGLQVLETDLARRSVIVRGPVDAVNKAFAVELHDYAHEGGRYRSHDGAVNLPSNIADYVEAVVGLTIGQVKGYNVGPGWDACTGLGPNLSDRPRCRERGRCVGRFCSGRRTGCRRLATQYGVR